LAKTGDIKRRIRSVHSTKKITKAMEMVAAAKLRKMQQRVVAARPFAEKLQEVMGRLVAHMEDFQHPLLDVRERKKVAYVLFTGDRGLCGGYNSNIIRLAESSLNQEEADSSLILVGRKGREYFRRRNYPITETFSDIGDEPGFIQAREIIARILNYYQDGTFDEVRLVYTKFRTAISQEPSDIKLLPLESPQAAEEVEAGVSDYIYEPSAEGVLKELLPKYVENYFYHALLESKTSEHGARMTAMGSASQNAEEMIDKLTMMYNRARQAAITTEISEIVGGAEALNK